MEESFGFFLVGILVGAGVLLTNDPVVTKQEVEEAEKLCSTNNGVKYLDTSVFNNFVRTTCNNGARFNHYFGGKK